MKIAIDIRMINNTGIGRYINNLVKNFQSVEQNVINYCLISQESIDITTDLASKIVNIKSSIFSIREQVEFLRVIEKQKPDIIHCPQFNIPLFSRVPIIVTIHDLAYDLFPEEFPNLLARLYYDIMMRLAINKSKKIIVPSESTKRDLINKYLVNESKINVIYHGIEDSFYSTSAKKESLEKFKIKGSYILYVGMNRPRKNLKALIEAFHKVQYKTNLNLVICGNEDNRFYDIKKDISNRGLTNKVIFTGYVSDDELNQLYVQSEFFIFPSLYEGFGFPVLEAMAKGIPVACSNNSSLPEIVGDAAVLFDPHNIDNIAESILKITNNAELQLKLRYLGPKQASKFTWKDSVLSHVEIYNDILSLKDAKK